MTDKVKTIRIRPAEQEKTAGRRKAPIPEPRIPGTVSDQLQGRMSDLLARYFSEVGQNVFNQSTEAVRESIRGVLQAGLQELGTKIRDELGRLGHEEASRYIRPWITDLVEDIQQQGIDDVSAAMQELAIEFNNPPEIAEEVPLEGMPAEEAQEVAPEEAPEVAPEEAAPETVEAPPAAAEGELPPEVQDILEGGGGAGVAAASTQKTVADVRREIRARNPVKKVVAVTTRSREELLKLAQQKLSKLEG